MEVTSMVYLSSKNLLIFHTKNDKVYSYNSVTGTHLSLLDTQLNATGHSMPEHGILRTNKTEDDLFSLVLPNKLAILTNVNKKGYDTLVSINIMDGHAISSYKPFNYDKVLTLCDTMMVLIH